MKKIVLVFIAVLAIVNFTTIKKVETPQNESKIEKKQKEVNNDFKIMPYNISNNHASENVNSFFGQVTFHEVNGVLYKLISGDSTNDFFIVSKASNFDKENLSENSFVMVTTFKDNEKLFEYEKVIQQDLAKPFFSYTSEENKDNFEFTFNRDIAPKGGTSL